MVRGMKKTDPIIWSITDGYHASINQFNYLTGESQHAELDKLFEGKVFDQQDAPDIVSALIDRCGWSIPEYCVYKKIFGTMNKNENPLNLNTFIDSILYSLSLRGHTGSFEIVNRKILSHHMCHALSAYHCSPFENCLVISSSTVGDNIRYSESIFQKNVMIDHYSPSYIVGPSSILSDVGHICKQHISPEVTRCSPESYMDYAEKVVNLGGYFNATVNLIRGSELLADYTRCMQALPDYQAWLTGEYFQKKNIQSNPMRAWDLTWEQDPNHERKNVWTEEDEMLHLVAVVKTSLENVKHTIMSKPVQKKISKSDNNIILVGNTFSHQLLTGHLKRTFPQYNFFVPPDPNDSGLSFGISNWKAAQLGWKGYDYDRRPKRQFSGIPFNMEGLGDAFLKSIDISVKSFADLLIQGNVIGFIQGNVENGNRSLGNRSILCDATNLESMNKINTIRKNKEAWYENFSSICRLEDAPKWFITDNYDNLYNNTFCVNTTNHFRVKCPGAVNNYNMAQVQTVTSESHPILHSLLSCYNNVYFNAPFCIKGNHLLNSWETAKEIYNESDLDYVVIVYNEGKGSKLRLLYK
tara:strand:+ start:219 stop:1964 length:1746 start_codon:yes stop_codon:yes gene_type:complete